MGILRSTRDIVPAQGAIFLCHSKEDKDLADMFDSVSARVGVRIYRKELEKMDPHSPPAEQIMKDILSSSVLFVLVGPGLISLLSQNKKESWLHTTNWMSFEVGLAAGVNGLSDKKFDSIPGRDIWIVTTDPTFNFPILTFDALVYLKNYKSEIVKELLQKIYELYKSVPSYRIKNDPALGQSSLYKCPNTACNRRFFTLWIPKETPFRCPSCGKPMVLRDGEFKSLPVTINPRILGNAVSTNEILKNHGDSNNEQS